MKRYYQYILQDCEKQFEIAEKHQVKDFNDKEYGAVYDRPEYTEPKPTAYQVGNAVALYLNRDSKYYWSDAVRKFIAAGLLYIERNQREDGTFDLVDCNFQSAADTAFLVKELIMSYRLLQQYLVQEDSVREIMEQLYKIIANAARGMGMGGFHTPNHRWAIASVMSSCMDIGDDLNSREIIATYLNEGIDCNEDGEYAERSAATYNVVNNTAMLALYENLGEAQYLEYVCRNLNMMLYYFEPDGTIFTDNSTRQDKGKKQYPIDYFYLYLFAAQRTNNEAFDAAAHKIISDQMWRSGPAPSCLGLLMLHRELLDYELKSYGFPTIYEKYFKGSGLVRFQNENYSLSMIGNSSKVLVFQAGETPVYLKIGVGYFDQRSFTAQSIEKIGESYELKYCARGWYYLPFEKQPDTSDWWAMKNENRDKLYKNEIEFTVTVLPKDDGIDISMKTQGIDRVLVRFEIGVPPTSWIDSKAMRLNCGKGEAVLIKKDMVVVNNGLDQIHIGPAFYSHAFIDGKFGSEERSLYHHTIYFTATTNFEKTFSMRV